jgi:hypothetical protein
MIEKLSLPNLLGSLGPGVYAVSTRHEYQKQKNNASDDKVRPACKADKFTGFCETIV